MTNKEIRALLGEITQWPWYSGVHTANAVYLDKALTDQHLQIGHCAHWDTQSPKDAKFIAQSPAIVSQLLDENEKLEWNLKRCQCVLEWYSKVESLYSIQEYLNSDQLGDLAREVLKEVFPPAAHEGKK